MPLSVRSTSQVRTWPAMLVVVVLGFSAIYLLPFLFPVHEKLSDSYLFGFNNHAAVILITVFVLGFAIWSRGLGLSLPERSGHNEDSFRTTALTAVLASVLGCAFFWAMASLLGPPFESQYFLDRYETFRQGGRLFQDFEFDYGPLLFYPAVWISKLSHLSLGNAYFLSWMLQWIAGTWLLWKVVRAAAKGTSHGRTIFLLLWLFFFLAVVESGANYTPLRYCGPLALVLAVQSLYEREAGTAKVIGVAVVGAVALLLYSPEQGIAFILATVFFFTLCVRRKWAAMFPGFVLFVLSMVVALEICLRAGLLSNILSVGAGGLDFPLLVSFQSLTILLLLLVAGCVFVTGFTNGSPDGPLAYLVCFSAMTLPAAFSRADVGHMVCNSLGALIAAMVVLSQYRAVWRWTWLSFGLLVLLAACENLFYVENTLAEHVYQAAFGQEYPSPAIAKIYMAEYRLTHKNADSGLEARRALVATHQSGNLQPLPYGTRVMAPFGAQRRLQLAPNGIEIITGYYPWMFPLANTEAIGRKIAELNAHPDRPLILPDPARQGCIPDPEDDRKFLRKFLLTPYVPRPRGRITAAEPMCDFLNQHYVPSSYASPVHNTYIWIRRDGSNH